MNRLILIGNGFDLAHNMKTKYSDFIFTYMKTCFIRARQKGEYDDGLVWIKQRHANGRRAIEEYTDLQDFLFFATSDEQNLNVDANIPFDKNVHKHYAKDYILKVKSRFFEHLLRNCRDYNWGDIENEYYSHLKIMLESDDSVEEELKKLNVSFSVIIDELQIFLKNQIHSDLKEDYCKIFTEEINAEDIVTVNLKDNCLPGNSLILNFNYTKTVEQYFQDINLSLYSNPIVINYIHGQIDNENNPIIFGFGDELDEKYKKIESDKRQGFLNFIKSFWYFKTSNYHDLIRFIESDIFQVYILGHSCGLSDRTMLNMIFEHDHCKSIKIFYHESTGSNNFSALTQEISRHFNNKGVMRKKIVPQSRCRPMPQV
jgi:hypothetical protein